MLWPRIHKIEESIYTMQSHTPSNEIALNNPQAAATQNGSNEAAHSIEDLALYYRRAVEIGDNDSATKLIDLYTAYHNNPHVIFHSAVALGKPDMLHFLAKLSNTNPVEFDDLLAYEPWNKIKARLTTESANLVRQRNIHNLYLFQCQFQQDCPLPPALSLLSTEYISPFIINGKEVKQSIQNIDEQYKILNKLIPNILDNKNCIKLLEDLFNGIDNAYSKIKLFESLCNQPSWGNIAEQSRQHTFYTWPTRKAARREAFHHIRTAALNQAENLLLVIKVLYCENRRKMQLEFLDTCIQSPLFNAHRDFNFFRDTGTPTDTLKILCKWRKNIEGGWEYNYVNRYFPTNDEISTAIFVHSLAP